MPDKFVTTYITAIHFYAGLKYNTFLSLCRLEMTLSFAFVPIEIDKCGYCLIIEAKQCINPVFTHMMACCMDFLDLVGGKLCQPQSSAVTVLSQSLLTI